MRSLLPPPVPQATALIVAEEQMPTAAGLWAKRDSSGKPQAWFRIIECNGLYEGKIAKIFPRPAEDPSSLRRRLFRRHRDAAMA